MMEKKGREGKKGREEVLLCNGLIEGLAPYRGLLLAPAEGWWPSAT